MEMLNRAYVCALASQARLNLRMDALAPDEYDYGLDGHFSLLTLRKGKPVPTGCELHYQLKATTEWKDRKEAVEYRIQKAAFNKMAYQNSRDFIPILLFLFCLPPGRSDWASFDAMELTIRKCCYWFHVGDQPLPSDKGRHRLLIPKENLLTPEAVGMLLGKVERREAFQ
jgi:hypothetical protein